MQKQIKSDNDESDLGVVLFLHSPFIIHDVSHVAKLSDTDQISTFRVRKKNKESFPQVKDLECVFFRSKTLFILSLQPAVTCSTGSASAFSPHLLLWSPRSSSGLWSECWPPPLLSSTCPIACCSASALLCGPSMPALGTTSSVTV